MKFTQLQAEEEAAILAGTACASPAPSAPGSIASFAAHTAARSSHHSNSQRSQQRALTRVQPVAHGASRSQHWQQAAVAQSTDGAPATTAQSGSERLEAMLAAAEQQATESPGGSVHISLPAASAMEGTSTLASTFCQEVKERIKKLQEEVERRDNSIANLHVEMQSLAKRHECASFTCGATAWMFRLRGAHISTCGMCAARHNIRHDRCSMHSETALCQ